MKPNEFGIREPDVEPAELIDADQLDFVITPLVGFDAACNRSGVGGGFYDRTFAFTKTEKATSTLAACPTLIGFAFELQKIKSFEVSEWDVALHGVATESNFYRGTGSCI